MNKSQRISKFPDKERPQLFLFWFILTVAYTGLFFVFKTGQKIR